MLVEGLESVTSELFTILKCFKLVTQLSGFSLVPPVALWIFDQELGNKIEIAKPTVVFISASSVSGWVKKMTAYEPPWGKVPLIQFISHPKDSITDSIVNSNQCYY